MFGAALSHLTYLFLFRCLFLPLFVFLAFLLGGEEVQHNE